MFNRTQKQCFAARILRHQLKFLTCCESRTARQIWPVYAATETHTAFCLKLRTRDYQ